MTDPIFESSLTVEEIERNFQGTYFFTTMMEGLEEALAFQKETASSKTVVHKRFLLDTRAWFQR